MPDNGVHASASPLESLREREVWLGEDVSVDAFGRKVADRSSVSLAELLSNCDIDIGDKSGAAFDLLEEMDAEDTLKALESERSKSDNPSPNNRDAAKAAGQMLLFRGLINETVGDAISIFLAVEAVLYLTDSDCSSWRAMYDDLPNRQIKVVVKDRGLFETTDAERICVQPAGLQAGIDKLVAEVPQGRCFVRPSGTEDVVRVYVEAATETEMLKLGQAVVNLVYDTAGGCHQPKEETGGEGHRSNKGLSALTGDSVLERVSLIAGAEEDEPPDRAAADLLRTAPLLILARQTGMPLVDWTTSAYNGRLHAPDV
eukprot:s6325_g4.t1